MQIYFALMCILVERCMQLLPTYMYMYIRTLGKGVWYNKLCNSFHKKIGKRYNAELSKYNVQCNTTFTLAVFYRASTVESTVPARHGTARHDNVTACRT